MNKANYSAIKSMADFIGEVFESMNFPIHPVRDVLVFMSCQAMLETGYLTSQVYKENFNLFGMRQPKNRPSFSYRENLNHAQYCSVKDSIMDYILWQIWNAFDKECYVNVSAFRHYLAVSPFNPSKIYTDTILLIYNKYYSYEQKEDSNC